MRPSRTIAWLATLFALLVAAPVVAQNDDDETSDDESTDEEEGSDDQDDQDDQDDRDDRDDQDEPEEKAEPTALTPEPAPVEAAAAGDAEVPADAAADPGPDERSYPFFDIGGYARGGFGFRVRPDALPSDELAYGFDGLAGISVTGWAHEMWRAKLIVEFQSAAFEALTVTARDDVLEATESIDRTVPGIVIEEATAAFIPSDMFLIKAGITRIPLTLQQQSKNTALMFPDRTPANAVFLSGSDIGVLARGDFWDGTLVTSFGVFNGESLTQFSRPKGSGELLENDEIGVVFAGRFDVNPFGRFTHGEGDLKRGPFRLGAGIGMTFEPNTVFDSNTSTEPRSLLETRLAASLRMAWKGLYIAAEYFRRVQEDDFSFRPELAEGAYAQLAYLIPFSESVGLEPIVRAGFVAADQTFDPRLTGYIDGGFNFYPVLDADMPDAVKLTLLYLGERRFSENEEAHGGATSIQVKF